MAQSQNLDENRAVPDCLRTYLPRIAPGGALVVALVTLLAGCGDDGYVLCDDETPVWTTIDAEVETVAEASTSRFDGMHAEVTVRDRSGIVHTFEVWGRPDLIQVGEEYLFEVNHGDAAYVGLQPMCVQNARQTVHIDGRSIDTADEQSAAGNGVGPDAAVSVSTA